MKKVLTAVFTLILLAGFSAPAFSAPRGTAEYERVKELKRAKREAKAHEKALPKSEKPKGFWQREAERSGFAGTGAMFSNAVFNAVPLERPNSRKSEN